MTLPLSRLRHNLVEILRAGIDAASAGRAVTRALGDETLSPGSSRPLHVIAAGKAAAPMASALVRSRGVHVRRVLAIGTHAPIDLDAGIDWMASAHPLPDERSRAAAAAALRLAGSVDPDDTLVLLLSGGASALMAAPIEGVSLDDKIAATWTLMAAGADIHALNTVRKHLSIVKGGRLAAACRGRTVTWAVSDVVGDDLSVIGSGPGVPDPTTWAQAAGTLEQYGGAPAYPAHVMAAVARGVAGEIPDTPKPGDAALWRSSALVIASRNDALRGAMAAAERLGYHPRIVDDPVTGEARVSGPEWLDRVRRLAADAPRPVCVLSAGETTVRVAGPGRGGRNQEFALSIAAVISTLGSAAVAASVGTDGIDGVTDAAGALVDSTTMARAAERGLGDPQRYLDDNDSFAFFDPLGDVIRLGRTDTNVGDMQVVLLGRPTNLTIS